MDRTFLAGGLLALCLCVLPAATGLADDDGDPAPAVSKAPSGDDVSGAALSNSTLSNNEEAPLAPLSTARANQHGNELLSEGRFDEAADIFREEALKRPENGILQRNLAGALARSGQGDESLAAYSQALRFAGDDQERAKVLFDLGNALAMGQQAEQALQVWAQAMLLDPADMDIKHNFEWLRRQMQQNEEEQQQQQDQQDDSNTEGDEGPEEQEPQQDQEKKGEQESPEQQEQDQQQEQQDSDAPDPDEMQPQPSEPSEEMGEEDAQRLLDAMLEEEKELQAERNQRKLTEKKNVEKDW